MNAPTSVWQGCSAAQYPAASKRLRRCLSSWSRCVMSSGVGAAARCGKCAHTTPAGGRARTHTPAAVTAAAVSGAGDEAAGLLVDAGHGDDAGLRMEDGGCRRQ